MNTPLGAVLAGGQSRRYGSPKALAEVAGARIVDRVVKALGSVVADLVLIANEPDLFEGVDLPTRPDIRPGLGALGGIHTALKWAEEEGRPGILAVAVDMPFLSGALLTRVRDLAFGDGAADVVAPSSTSRRGVEPLSAAYRVSAIPAIEAEFERGESHVIGFYEEVTVHRIPMDEVLRLCDPKMAFLNVNTPEDRERAELLAREAGEAS